MPWILQPRMSQVLKRNTGATALMIRFYDGIQYVVIFLAGFVPFSSNLLKNLQVFLLSPEATG